MQIIPSRILSAVYYSLDLSVFMSAAPALGRCWQGTQHTQANHGTSREISLDLPPNECLEIDKLKVES